MALAFSHFLNDLMQSLVPALYPMLKGSHRLSFAQIGTIALTMQKTSSLLQPAVGLSTDRRPQPYALPIGSIDFVYQVCAYLPAVGLLTALLPNLGRPAPAPAR